MIGGFPVDKFAQLMALMSTTEFKSLRSDVNRQVSGIYVNGVVEPFLVFSWSDFVGWIRLEGTDAVWRYGSLRTGRASLPRRLGDLTKYYLPFVMAFGDAVIEVQLVEPSVDPAGGEPEEFVRSIENGQTPPAWSRAFPDPDGTAQLSSLPVAASMPAPPATTQPAVEFSPYLHSRDRYPAACGFTEQQLNGVPLMTVYPAVIPAIIGGIFLFVAFLGAPYEFYVVLRWAVSAMAIWICTIASGQHRTGWVVAFAAVGVLFNPFIPFILPREIWVVPDLLGAILFATAGGLLRASRPATENDKLTGF
jgi:hypothetical protein